MTSEQCERACDIRSVPGSREPAGRALTPAEIGALFHGCAGDRSARRGARDAAVLALLYGCGLRRAELCALRREHLRAGTLLVRGKGNRERRVPIPRGARRALARWLEHRGLGDGPVFPTRSGAALVESAVYKIVDRRAWTANVDASSPHDLRRTYGSTLLMGGADLVTVQRLMGHSRLDTTALYDRRGEEERLKAADLVHVPFEDRFETTLIALHESAGVARASGDGEE